MILVDFQIMVASFGITQEQRKELHLGFFPVYEAVRFWLKERKIVAPFNKLAITLRPVMVPLARHKSAQVILGICMVQETVDDVLQHIGDHGWTCACVLEALEYVSSAVGWSCPELEMFVQELAQRKPPCAHTFRRLSRVTKLGLVCDVLFESDVGLSVVKVRLSIGSRPTREIVVKSLPGPLWLEDDYPVRSTKLQGGEFILLDREKNVLSRVDIAHGLLIAT